MFFFGTLCLYLEREIKPVNAGGTVKTRQLKQETSCFLISMDFSQTFSTWVL